MTRLKFLKQIALLVGMSVPFSATADNTKTIGITQIVEHPSLNAIRAGILEELKRQGFVEDENLKVIYESAQGNPVLATQIAQKFASLSLDAVVPISTPSAQSIVHLIKSTPVIFAAITDPLAAKVVTSLKTPGGNVTGVMDTPPLAEQLNVMETCGFPLKVLGVVYNPGEANSVAMLEKLKELTKEKNITLFTVTVSKSADVQAAANSLVNRVDAIFVGNDNTVVSGLESLVKTCLNEKKPLFVSDPDSVKRGALAAYAYDQHLMGKQVGSMVANVLKGKNPENMPVERATDLKFSMNAETAEKLKITCKIAPVNSGEKK